MEPTHRGNANDRIVPIRRLFMVLSPRSLPYANLCLSSLFQNSAEQFHLSLITDADADKQHLATRAAILGGVGIGTDGCNVFSASDLDEREEDKFANLRHLRSFRRGHPCWRKITDPLLLSEKGEEMIILDPDLYFPNRFSFEPTPNAGLLLMWQKPSCLFPPEVVLTAISAGVPLAHHVDIGVAHWRATVDLEWLNWLIGELGSSDLPRSMHVEAIIWAAIAMRIGGGYLDPGLWVCWRRTQYVRVLRKLGVSGPSILRRQNLSGIKCLHAGGEAKWWLADAYSEMMLDQSREVISRKSIEPFVELTPTEYSTLQRNRRWLRRLGYYAVFGN
jgi:hypothetical protein